MNFKNSKQFVQALEEFDNIQKKMDGFPERTSMKRRFYSLADDIRDTKAYNWWRKVPIVLLVLAIELLILWQLIIHNVKGGEGMMVLFMATFLIGFNLIQNRPLQEAYIRRKKFAHQLREETAEAKAHYDELKQQNDKKRNDAVNKNEIDVVDYYSANDFIDFMTTEQIQKYWEQKTLPSILADCDKVDEYIQLSLVRVDQEREFLKAIINYKS